MGSPKFKVMSDHKPLEKLQLRTYSEVTNFKVRRTMELLNMYNFEVVHVAGKVKEVTDCLSRKPLWQGVDTKSEDVPTDLDEEMIRQVTCTEDAASR